MGKGITWCWAAAAALLCVSSLAQAAKCDDARSAEQVTDCIGNDLFDADQKLNLAYTSLMDSLDDVDKTKLRTSQRAWIKERNEVCTLDDRERDKQKWHDALARDHKRALCVARYSRARTLELESMISQRKFRAAAAAHPQRDYQIVSAEQRSSGRWYFEVLLKAEDISRMGSASMWVGCGESKSNTGVGHPLRIRAGHGRGETLIGVALDLEQGKFYHSVDGEWQSGAPGSSGGLDVKLGRDYSCGVDSTELIKPLLDRQLMQVNFGEKPLYYAPPQGYQPLRGAAQWIYGGTSSDGKRVSFDYASIDLKGDQPRISALQENPDLVSAPQTPRKIKALQAALTIDCRRASAQSTASYYVGADLTYVANAMFPFKIEQSSSRRDLGGRLIRTLCMLKEKQFNVPDLAPPGRLWEELASPVTGVRIFEAMDRRQQRNGQFVIVNKNETATPVEYNGKPSRVLVVASLLDCRELVMHQLVIVRYDERGRLLGGDYFKEDTGLPRLPVNRMRLVTACAAAEANGQVR